MHCGFTLPAAWFPFSLLQSGSSCRGRLTKRKIVQHQFSAVSLSPSPSNYSPSYCCSCCCQTSIKKTSSSSLPCILSSTFLPPAGHHLGHRGHFWKRCVFVFFLFCFSFQINRTNSTESITTAAGIDGTRYSGRTKHGFPSSWIFLAPGSGGHCLFLRERKKNRENFPPRKIPAPREHFSRNFRQSRPR